MLVERIKSFCTAVGADIKALWAAVNQKMPRRGLYVNQGNANERRYYLIGRITNNNGSFRVKGLIGGHDIHSQGGGAVDLSIHSRAGNIPIMGFVGGNLGLQDLQVYKSATNEVFIYLVSGHYGLTDLEYSETLGGTVYFSPGFTLETPAHTLIFSAAALAPGLGLLRLVGGVEATPTAAGLLSAVDKEKLDGLAVGVAFLSGHPRGDRTLDRSGLGSTRPGAGWNIGTGRCGSGCRASGPIQQHSAMADLVINFSGEYRWIIQKVCLELDWWAANSLMQMRLQVRLGRGFRRYGQTA
ncbi:MAG: hypothetical protein ACN6OM_08925 [Alcaligenes nematophilus]|uniref:hypothetical protein n=1 Tax=Alcaligenes nematophilus TaxID=2994643 RepID=UPI003CFF5E31